jgi:hypothetical protein
VAELDGHRLIGYTANPEMNRWPLRNSGSEAAYQVGQIDGSSAVEGTPAVHPLTALLPVTRSCRLAG